MTTFENKCRILSDVWLTYRNDENFKDFVAYNDLGLPLAYMVDNDIVKSSEKATMFIEEAFSLMLAGLGIDEDRGYEYLEEMLADSTK